MSDSTMSDDGEGAPVEVLEQVLEILEDTHDDLASCGSAVLALVERAINSLNIGTSSSSSPSARATHLSRASVLSNSLLRLADEQLNAFPYTSVPLCWRRLYTDATLLGAVANLAVVGLGEGEPANEEQKKRLEETVKKLDMALIIAGAPGEGREELVFALLEVAQDRLRSLRPQKQDLPLPPSKRRRLSLAPTPSRLPPPYIARPIPTLPSLPAHLHLAPSPAPFHPAHPHSSPFVVRGACSTETGWSAVDSWRDPSYLIDKAGPGRVVPVEVGGDYTKEGWGQRVMPFSEFLDTLSPTSSSTSSPSHPVAEAAQPLHYLAQHSLFRQFPSLLADLTIPDLVYSAPSTDGNGEAYEGVKTEDGFIVNAWLGPGGTKSAAHTDPWWNCYVQVTGSKWVWVAPPSCSSAMAAFGSVSPPPPSTQDPPSTSLEPDVDVGAESSSSAQAEQYMSNTSSLDVTVPPPSPFASPSSESGYYPPAWLRDVEPFARQVVLEAGDVLVMPPKWWHAMKSLETSFSVSIWF